MFRLGNKKALGQELKCKIKLLVPDEDLEIGYTINTTGQELITNIVKELDLLDKDYFGLKFHDQIQWLDSMKTVVKQTKGAEPVVFELRFKYYPAEPALLANESTRYYLYLQLRLDLLESRLKCDTHETAAYLIACVLQSELGDADIDSKQQNYVSEFKFVPNQTEELEWSSIRLHQNEDFQGLQPADAELNFLKKACQLDTYGIDPYPVKEGNSHNHFLIGVNHLGISTFQDSKKTNRFSWEEIERIALDNKLVLIYCRKLIKKGDKTSKSRPLFVFRCPTQDYAHNFWKIASEHKYFFTLESTPDLPIVINTGGLFKKSHKLKYTGRVEKDLLRDHVDESRTSGVKRSHSLMSKTNDGPRWQGFQAGNTALQHSMNNIYGTDQGNKTLPSNLNHFKEEDEDLIEEPNQQSINSKQAPSELRKRSSAGSMSGDKKDLTRPPNFTRKTTLTTKNEAINGENFIRRGSQIYMDTNQQTHIFIETTLFLVVFIIVIILTILLLNDSDRPNSVSLLVKKMNLEPLSRALRENYYLPLKSAVREGLGQIFSILDSKLY